MSSQGAVVAQHLGVLLPVHSSLLSDARSIGARSVGLDWALFDVSVDDIGLYDATCLAIAQSLQCAHEAVLGRVRRE